MHAADLSKNTLQVKVAVDNPSDLLKPDMLARVKFLAVGPAGSSGADSQGSSLVVYAPTSGRAWVKRLLSLHNDTIAERERGYRHQLETAPVGGEVELF